MDNDDEDNIDFRIEEIITDADIPDTDAILPDLLKMLTTEGIFRVTIPLILLNKADCDGLDIVIDEVFIAFTSKAIPPQLSVAVAQEAPTAVSCPTRNSLSNSKANPV